MYANVFKWLVGGILLAFAMTVGYRLFVQQGEKGPYQSLDGGQITLSQFNGKPRVMLFWATWCRYCRQSIDDLVKLQAKYRKQDLVVIWVTSERDAGLIRGFASQYKLSDPVLMMTPAQSAKLRESFGDRRARAIPFMVTIDRNNKVVELRTGAQPSEVLQRSVERIL